MVITKEHGGRPGRTSIHAAVDPEMGLLLRIAGLPHPSVAPDIWDGIWYEETHHSTAIEGNTLILRGGRRLVQEGSAVGEKGLKEYLEVQGYAEAARWVYSQAHEVDIERDQSYVDLTELREIHRLVVAIVWEVAPPVDFVAGEGPASFRLHDNLPFDNGTTPAPFTDIAPRISDWLRFANEEPADGRHLMEHLGAGVRGRVRHPVPGVPGQGRTACRRQRVQAADAGPGRCGTARPSSESRTGRRTSARGAVRTRSTTGASSVAGGTRRSTTRTSSPTRWASAARRRAEPSERRRVDRVA